jgi:hypothetical protein
LAGNIDRHGKLGLKLALGVTATADKRAMVLDRNINHLRDLVLTLTNDLLNTLDNLVDDVGTALNLDSVAISLLLGELNGTGKLSSVVRATGLDNNVTEVGT